MIMNCTYEVFFNELEKEFTRLEDSETEPLLQAQTVLSFLEEKLKLLNKWLKYHVFETPEEEIYFFKFLKPSFVSKIIFYKSVLKTESHVPINKKEKLKYFNRSLNKIHDLTVENHIFFTYFRTASSFKDNDYFLRKTYKDIIQDDLMLLNFDSKISTSHDYLMAQMLSAATLTKYFEERIDQIQNKASFYPIKTYQWGGTQTDFVEIVYVLHYFRVINNGNLCIKEFAINLGKFLNVEINANKVYDTFQKIKGRKTDPTKFLSKAIENFCKKISEESFRK